jgi:hypothetical protein
VGEGRIRAAREHPLFGEEDEGFRRLKGIAAFDRRSLAVAKALYEYRDQMARADRHPSRSSATTRSWTSRAKVVTEEDLAKVSTSADASPPLRPRDPSPLARSGASEEARKGRRKQWLRQGTPVACGASENHSRQESEGTEDRPGVLAPKHVLTALATTRDLQQVPAMRDWQRAPRR